MQVSAASGHTAAAVAELVEAFGISPRLGRALVSAGASLPTLRRVRVAASALLASVQADRAHAGKRALTLVECGAVESIVEELARERAEAIAVGPHSGGAAAVHAAVPARKAVLFHNVQSRLAPDLGVPKQL